MKAFARLAVGLGLFYFACGPKAAAQYDFFRYLGTPRQTSQVEPIGPEEEEKYNLLVGPVRFSAAAGVAMEWNDNISLSDDDRQSDFIFRPSLSVDAKWQISQLNTLRFSLGASYAKYLEHSEFDTRGLLLSPNTELAFTVHIDNVALTFRDRFSYQEDPFGLPVLSDQAVYRRYENLASVQADWQATDLLTITLGYSHYNFWSRDDDFAQLDRSVDSVYLRPSIQITPAAAVGVHASVSWVDFDEDVQNDGTSYMLGPFTRINLTESVVLYAEAGWQEFTFEDGGSILDNEDASTWYLKTYVEHIASDYFAHRLAFSKTAEVGYDTNFFDLYHAEYSANWKLAPNFSVDPTAFYEHYETSGAAAEEANRWGAALGLRYILTPSITLGADYRFILKDSNIEDSDYRQNLVLLSLYYNF